MPYISAFMLFIHSHECLFLSNTVEDVVIVDLPVKSTQGSVVTPAAGGLGADAIGRNTDTSGGQVFN